MSKETKYEAAFAELQTIVRKMENDELDIDQMAEELKRAQELIKLCKDSGSGLIHSSQKLSFYHFYALFVAYLQYYVYFCKQFETLTRLRQ